MLIIESIICCCHLIHKHLNSSSVHLLEKSYKNIFNKYFFQCVWAMVSTCHRFDTNKKDLSLIFFSFAGHFKSQFKFCFQMSLQSRSFHTIQSTFHSALFLASYSFVLLASSDPFRKCFNFAHLPYTSVKPHQLNISGHVLLSLHTT